MSDNSYHDSSRRNFIKKLAYVPPVVMTLNAVPAHATTGSNRCDRNNEGGNHSGGSNYQGANNHGSGNNHSGGFNFRGGNHGHR